MRTRASDQPLKRKSVLCHVPQFACNIPRYFQKY